MKVLAPHFTQAAVDAIVADAVAKERGAIVAFLNAKAALYADDPDHWDGCLRTMADQIETGNHLPSNDAANA